MEHTYEDWWDVKSHNQSNTVFWSVVLFYIPLLSELTVCWIYDLLPGTRSRRTEKQHVSQPCAPTGSAPPEKDPSLEALLTEQSGIKKRGAREPLHKPQKNPEGLPSGQQLHLKENRSAGDSTAFVSAHVWSVLLRRYNQYWVRKSPICPLYPSMDKMFLLIPNTLSTVLLV